jgi:hypothetical protein
VTEPKQVLTALTDDDNVRFIVVDDDEGDQPGTGLTDSEVNDFLNTSPEEVKTLTASGDTESLYANVNGGGNTVPWRIRNGVGCSGDKPYAVVKVSDNSVAGCHETHAQAAAQLRALYASETESTVVDIETLDVNDPGIIKISAEAYGSDRDLREYWTHGEGAAKIRWGTPGDFDRCVRHLGKYVRNPQGLCNEYHVEAVGAPPGKGHSAGTESFEVTTVDAPVQRVGTTNPRSISWEGVLAIEGEETGDGREFANGSLGWATPPLPLMYQYETSHGGTTDKSTNVGNITEVWRDGNKIMGRGTIDLDDQYGMQAARKMKGKYLNGVSIDADSVKESDVELVFAQPDPSMSEEQQLIEMMAGAAPEKTIFHKGRVRGATLVNLPAFVGASLELTGDLSMLDEEPLTAAGGKVRRYIRDLRGRFDDDPNAKNHEGGGDTNPPKVDSTRSIYRGGLAQGGIDDEDYEIIGDPESDEGAEVRPRSRRPTYTNNAEEDDSGFYDDETPEEKRRRRERRDAALDSDYDVRVVTAAATPTRRGYTIEIPEVPPIGFFREPTELPPIGAVWIEPNGHIFGLVGPSGVPHRAFRNKRITIPMGNVDYTRWMNRPTVVMGEDGELIKIRTGVITMNCGHLSPYASDDAEERMSHYDNSCSIAAVVRVGESRQHKAPWVAGAIMPMSSEDFLRFSACQLSGDWPPHRERRGWKEFVAALAVPVPGFARSTNVAAVRVDDNSVVTASTVPIMLTEAAYVEDTVEAVDTGTNRMELGRIRARLGIDNRQALADIRRRITTGTVPLTASAATVLPPKERKVGCAPCAAKRRGNGETSAQQPPVVVTGFGDGDPQAQAAASQANAIANSRTTSRG